MAISLFNFLGFYGKSGLQLIDAGDLTKLTNYNIGTLTGLTALAGGGQTGATLLGVAFNEVDTVATGGDSVMLPSAVPGTYVWVNNNGANSLNIFANLSNPSNAPTADQMVATNTITKTAAGSAIALASGHTTCFVCTTIGVFKQFF